MAKSFNKCCFDFAEYFDFSLSLNYECLNNGKPQEKAIKEAVQRPERALAKNASTSPVIGRIHRVRGEIMAATQLKDLASFTFLQNKMDCSVDEAERAVTRALQLHSDIKEIKLFNNYRYHYHDSMSPEDPKAATILKENYIRMMRKLHLQRLLTKSSCYDFASEDGKRRRVTVIINAR